MARTTHSESKNGWSQITIKNTIEEHISETHTSFVYDLYILFQQRPA